MPKSSILGSSDTLLGGIILGGLEGFTFTANAVIKKTQSGSLFLSALLFDGHQIRSLKADAVIVPSSGYYSEFIPDDSTGFARVGVFYAPSAVVRQKLYRWNPLLGQYVLLLDNPAPNFEYVDVTAYHGVPYWYRIDAINSAGSVVGSVTTDTKTVAYDEWVLLTSEDDPLELPVIGSSFQRNKQTEAFAPIPARYKTVQVGSVLGHDGTIDIAVSADERHPFLSRLQDLSDSRSQVYLKSPFGHVFPVVIGGIRESFGPGGHATVTVSYTENGVA